MAVMELVQHVAKSGKFAPQDARIIRAPAQTIESMAASLRTELPALEDTETSGAGHSRGNYGKLATNRPTVRTQISNSTTLSLIASSTNPLRYLHWSRNTVHRPRQFNVA